MPLGDVAEIEELSPDIDIGDYYEKYQLVRLTGWPLEYIERLGLMDRESLTQIDDAIASIRRPKSRKGSKSTWP